MIPSLWMEIYTGLALICKHSNIIYDLSSYNLHFIGKF
jgi:hypothetical protein